MAEAGGQPDAALVTSSLWKVWNNLGLILWKHIE